MEGFFLILATLYQEGLRECGYRGPFPYWDWTRDTAGNAPIGNSPIFNPTTGFGGTGVPNTYTLPTTPENATFPLNPEAFSYPAGCVGTGPFKNTVLHVGPNKRYTDHCLVRRFLEDLRFVMTPANINNILSQGIYDAFWNSLDGLPYKLDVALHDGGHGFIGGDMASFYTSNNGASTLAFSCPS